MLTALFSLTFLASTAIDAPGAAPSTVPIAIITALGTAAAVLGAQMILRKQTKDKLIAEASEELIGGAKSLLEDYRKELTAAKAELKELRERVAKLEEQLRLAKEDRSRIERERLEALRQLSRVQQRVDDLERMLQALGHVPPPPAD